jgi:spoIIIJ-associated protein
LSKRIERARSVELAIEKACDALQVSPGEIGYEVIQPPKKGFLGIFGRRDAIVEVSVIRKESPGEYACQFLKGIVERIGWPCQVEMKEQPAEISFVLKGEDLSLLIGKHGRTLNAIQTLVQTVVWRKYNNGIRVTVDAGDYRRRRKESLKHLAAKMMEKVRETKKEVTLHPMSASERKMIHRLVQREKDLTTYSVGKEPRRSVVIDLRKNQ